MLLLSGFSFSIIVLQKHLFFIANNNIIYGPIYSNIKI
jgi:hypothetical protein